MPSPPFSCAQLTARIPCIRMGATRRHAPAALPVQPRLDPGDRHFRYPADHLPAPYRISMKGVPVARRVVRARALTRAAAPVGGISRADFATDTGDRG